MGLAEPSSVLPQVARQVKRRDKDDRDSGASRAARRECLLLVPLSLLVASYGLVLEQSGCLLVAMLLRQIQGHLPGLVHGIDVCLPLDEELDYILSPLARGVVESTPAPLVDLVHLRSVLKQDLADAEVALKGCLVKRCAAGVVRGCGRNPFLQEFLRDVEATFGATLPQVAFEGQPLFPLPLLLLPLEGRSVSRGHILFLTQGLLTFGLLVLLIIACPSLCGNHWRRFRCGGVGG
mmetsp:Transcript_100874/g.225334  ORF Transcript_100874/g.225334 Transcript_100874/m.225334 type:complete len:236 (-) Transcript_100874:23-730(-)